MELLEIGTDGSATAPSLGNTGDANTGMYWPGKHQFGFAGTGSRTMYRSETKRHIFEIKLMANKYTMD